MRTVRKAVWFFGRFLFTWLFYRLFFRLQVEGREHLPATGPVILYANHLSWHDIPVLGCAATRWIRFMAKEELFRIPVFGAVLRFLGAFPVRRGAADRQALKTALELLREGEVVGIFPEGTRSRTGRLGRAEPGLAYMVWKSGAPAVPCGISSTYRLFSPIRVRFGPPVTLNLGERATSEELAAASQRLMAAVAALLDPQHRGPGAADLTGEGVAGP